MSAGERLLAGLSWEQLRNRHSFIELDALARCTALLDAGTMRVLLGPFARVESPWLQPQGITPQSDDGVVIARGMVGGAPVVIAAIEQRFQGGAIGEVSGAKITDALRHAVAESAAGAPTAAIILFETGGVRLQEANLGLNAVAEICSAVLDLRRVAPVVGIVAGTVGCFGGMGIVAGLCTRLIVTPQARLGLNGPAVIEQEHGIDEFDSHDHTLIWAVDGGQARHAAGLADDLVADDVDLIRVAVTSAVRADAAQSGHHRSQRLDDLATRIDAVTTPAVAANSATATVTRGRAWLSALTAGHQIEAVIPSVLRVLTDDALYLAVVPDPDNRFHCARNGEVGLTESLALARAVRDLAATDTDAPRRRPIIAVVDLPSQAYGRIEETVGLHQVMAAATDAYHAARTAGHPVVALVVGSALSGGFLTHGLQANQILALADPGVEIHAMHREAAARITLRTVADLERLATTITPLSFRVSDWATLGFCDGLLRVDDADTPTADDIALVHGAIEQAVESARSGPWDLSNRLDSAAAATARKASRTVHDQMAHEWADDT